MTRMNFNLIVRLDHTMLQILLLNQSDSHLGSWSNTPCRMPATLPAQIDDIRGFHIAVEDLVARAGQTLKGIIANLEWCKSGLDRKVQNALIVVLSQSFGKFLKHH